MNKPARGSLLDIEHLSAAEITSILQLARRMNPSKPRPVLRGKRVLLLFYEPSTRTRSSFEIAAKEMGAMTTLVLSSGSSIEKGESLLDTAYTLQAVGADVMVIRNPYAGAPLLMATHLKVPVINAGDGMHEHPSQALLDAYTILRHKKTLKGLRVVIIGDIYHSRVARSAIHLLSKFGSQVTLCGPPEFLPDLATSLAPDLHITRSTEEAVRGADVVMVLRVPKRAPRRNQDPPAGLHFPLSDDHGPDEVGETRRSGDASWPNHSGIGADLGSGGLSSVGDCRRSAEWSAGAHGDPGARCGKSVDRAVQRQWHKISPNTVRC